MALEEYFVAGARGNPINHDYLPASTPEIEFPVRTYSKREDQKHAGGLLCAFWLCSVITTLLFFTSGIVTVVVTIIIIHFAVGLSDCHPWTIIRRYAFPTVASFLAMRVALPDFAIEFIVFTGIALIWESRSFGRHYVEIASCGMIDKTTRTQFRRRGILPTGLKSRSRLRGLVDAIVSYLTYNRDEVRVPGVFVSPSGGQSWRVTKIATLSVLATLSLLVSLTASAGPSFSPPADGILMLVFLIPSLGVLFLVSFFFLVNIRVLGRAFALKSKRISASHWRRMLEDIKASKDEQERNSVWLGFVNYDHSPILYPIDSLFRHSWIVGKTGSSKTAWMMGLVDQLIYRGDVSVAYIDLKAITFEVLHTMQQASKACAKTGTTPRVSHFTLEHGEHTHLLDIFHQDWWKKLPTTQRM